MDDPPNLVLSLRTVIITAACLPLIVSALILTFRKMEQPASRYLAALLAVCVIAMGPQIIGYAGFYDVWPGLTFFPFFTELWIGPLFYLHAYKLTYGGRLGWRKLLLAPGIAQTGYYLWAFLFLGDYKNKWEFNEAFHVPYFIPLETVIGVGLIVCALWAVWRLTKKYKLFLENTQSAAIEFNPVWLTRVIIVMIVAAVIYIGLEVAELLFPVSYNAAFPFQVMVTLALAWLSVEALWRLRTPFPKMSEFSAPISLLEKNWHDEGARTLSRITKERWFLEPRLSIRDIASRMGTNETYISRAMNRGVGMSFNTLINNLRVEHAKSHIRESDLSLLSIALESGFNSKATFNRVFRDTTGMTPSAYKKSQRSQNQ